MVAGAGLSTEGLLAAAENGSVRAIARLLSRIEAGGASAAEVAGAVLGRPRVAVIVGLTGPPGVGKSTLTAAMITQLRARGRRVAVLAVDPSSPFSGGALLGDRVRMGEHSTDSGVFIRSMSSRGELGGLSAAAPAAADLLSAIGFDDVLVETVGVGQNEIAVLRLADTVVVALAPGMGDGIQAAKAGILEIADVLVVNKSDHEGAGRTVRDLKGMVALGRAGSGGPGSWRIPVLSTVASSGVGVAELLVVLGDHRQHLLDHGGSALRSQRRAQVAVQAVVLEHVQRALRSPAGQQELASVADQVAAGRIDHHNAAREVLDWLGSAQEG
ncbi:MAG: methylmalonyl Co-A mutase-associated GTPase MeaB [Nakamurella sp.]